MRNAFAKEITNQARKRKDIVLLSGDIGNRMFDEFKKVAPERFINCGIAEANMMSVASGLALSGLRPIVYTITPFTTTRCLEQIKIGAAYHNASIIIVGTGSGLSYSELGATHHSLEDMAILRSIPDIRIQAPIDSLELVMQLREAIEVNGPTYIRIGKKGEKTIHAKSNTLGISKGQMINQGKDCIILCIGPIIEEAIKARDKLKGDNVDLGIASLGGIVPLDENFLKDIISRKYKTWITLEEHYNIGGLGSTILEWLNDNKLLNSINLYRMGSPKEFIHELGDQHFTRNQLGLDANSIVDFVKRL